MSFFILFSLVTSVWGHAPSEIIFIIWTSNIIFSTIHTVFCSGLGLCLLHSDVPLLVRGLVSSHLKHVTRYSSSSWFFPLQVIVKHQMFEKVAYLPLSLFRVEKYWKNFCFRILWHRYHCNLKQEKKIKKSLYSKWRLHSDGHTHKKFPDVNQK